VGAALTVAVGMGVYPNMDAVDDLIEISRVVEPRQECQGRYQDLYHEYHEVYAALAPIYRRLHKVR